MKPSPLVRLAGGLLFAALAFFARDARASSHREALAILNEPCADNTDTYAWVSDGAHDKLYLIMDFNPLHEPGQGNQGFRACNGYRYEFHIGKGTSLKDEAVYRVEFKNTLTPEAAPSPTDNLGGGNELLWQLTGGTETMTVTRIMAPGTATPTVIGENLPSCRTTTARRPTGSSTASARSRATTAAIPPAASRASTISPSSTPSSTTSATAAASSPASSTIPYQLDEKGIFDLVNLGRERPRRDPGRAQHAGRGRLHRLQRLLHRPRDSDRGALPERHSAQRHAAARLDGQPAARLGEHQPPATQTVDASNIVTGVAARAPSSRSAATRCRSSTPASSARSARRSTCTPPR